MSGATGQGFERPVVVGVDGSKENQSAIAWAADEAVRTKKHLVLLTVAEKVPPVAAEGLDYEGEHFDPIQYAGRIADDVKAKLEHQYHDLDVSVDVRFGPSLDGVIAASETAHMMVVGKRGLGAFKRFMVGSNSIGLAGRSYVPTVIVPSTWMQTTHRGEPVLAAVTPEHDSDDLLAFGLERARDFGVPLVVLFVWETHPAVTPNAEERKQWGDRAKTSLEAVIAPWRDKFPDVEVLPTAAYGHSARDLIDASEHAQLLVIGRRSAPASSFGFGFGSTTRALLHYVERPVAVVPTGK